MTAGSRSTIPFPFEAQARLANNLYRAREAVGLGQREAAARAALTSARLDAIEGGEYLPGLDVLVRLAYAYSSTAGALLSGVSWRPGGHAGRAEYLVFDE